MDDATARESAARQAYDTASATLQAAESKSKDVVAEALRNAKAEAEKITADANRLAEDYLAKARQIHADAAQLSAAVDAERQKLADVKDEVATWDKRLADAKDAARKILG
jgi:hypothetical protein